MTQENKDNVKRIIAKAQILRDGVFSKYVHGQISLNDLKIAFDLTSKPTDNVAEAETISGNEPSGKVEAPKELDLSALTATLNSLDLDQARLMMEVLQGRITALESDKVAKVA